MTAIPYSYEILTHDQIDLNDKRFCLSYPLENHNLTACIRDFGFIAPLVVKASSNGYTIVTGFKRIIAASALNIQKIPVLITNLDDVSAFKYAMSDNLSHRSYNVFEISMIVNKLLKDFKISRQIVIKNFLPFLGYNPHEKILEQLCIPYQFSEPQRDMLYQAHIESEKILLFKYIDVDAWDAVIKLLYELKPSIHVFNQIIELTREICQRGNISLNMLFHDKRIEAVFCDATRTRSQKLANLRNILRQWRNPKLTQAEHEYKKRRNCLKLDSRIQLKPPPFFEGDYFNIEMQFKSKDELKKYASDLLRISDDPALDDLINFL